MLTLTNRHAERMTAAELAGRAHVPVWVRARLATLTPATVIDVTWIDLPTRRECLCFSFCHDTTTAPSAARAVNPWTGD